jgi:hypothetical protein
MPVTETELLTESLSRVRGIVMPVTEHETFNINWGRIRHEAFTVAQTEGVGAAIVRLRGLAEAITEVTGQSYTINLHHDPYDLKVTVSWTEWGEVQQTTPSVLMPIKGGAVCIMD